MGAITHALLLTRRKSEIERVGINRITLYTVSKEIDFLRYNMKCSGENMKQCGIVHVV